MSEVKVVILVLSLEGPLFVALGYAMRGMQPSRLAGIRYRATLADERVWRDTHERCGPRFALVGWITLSVGLTVVLAPVPDAAALGIFTGAAVGSFVAFAIDSYRYASARLQHYRRLDAGGAGTGAD